MHINWEHVSPLNSIQSKTYCFSYLLPNNKSNLKSSGLKPLVYYFLQFGRLTGLSWAVILFYLMLARDADVGTFSWWLHWVGKSRKASPTWLAPLVLLQKPPPLHVVSYLAVSSSSFFTAWRLASPERNSRLLCLGKKLPDLSRAKPRNGTGHLWKTQVIRWGEGGRLHLLIRGVESVMVKLR